MDAFSLSAFFGMSYSIKDAFQQGSPSGVIYNLSTYCDAFDVLAKVRKFMTTAFLKVQGLKHSAQRTRLAEDYEWKSIKHFCNRRTFRAFVEDGHAREN